MLAQDYTLVLLGDDKAVLYLQKLVMCDAGIPSCWKFLRAGYFKSSMEAECGLFVYCIK